MVHTIQLKNQHGKIFYDKLTFLYLEVPNFKKTEAELVTRLDKWLYFIKHLEDLQTIPTIMGDDIFTQAFDKAALAKFTEKDIYDYEVSLKHYRDYYNTIDYAFGYGKTEEKIERIIKFIKRGKDTLTEIAEIFDVPLEFVMQIKTENNL